MSTFTCGRSKSWNDLGDGLGRQAENSSSTVSDIGCWITRVQDGTVDCSKSHSSSTPTAANLKVGQGPPYYGPSFERVRRVGLGPPSEIFPASRITRVSVEDLVLKMASADPQLQCFQCGKVRWGSVLDSTDVGYWMLDVRCWRWCRKIELNRLMSHHPRNPKSNIQYQISNNETALTSRLCAPRPSAPPTPARVSHAVPARSRCRRSRRRRSARRRRPTGR